MEAVEKKMPRRVKRKRPILLEDGTEAGGMEEYYDYIFPVSLLLSASLQFNVDAFAFFSGGWCGIDSSSQGAGGVLRLHPQWGGSLWWFTLVVHSSGSLWGCCFPVREDALRCLRSTS